MFPQNPNLEQQFPFAHFTPYEDPHPPIGGNGNLEVVVEVVEFVPAVDVFVENGGEVIVPNPLPVSKTVVVT